jgi:hypothetical protein
MFPRQTKSTETGCCECESAMARTVEGLYGDVRGYELCELMRKLGAASEWFR